MSLSSSRDSYSLVQECFNLRLPGGEDLRLPHLLPRLGRMAEQPRRRLVWLCRDRVPRALNRARDMPAKDYRAGARREQACEAQRERALLLLVEEVEEHRRVDAAKQRCQRRQARQRRCGRRRLLVRWWGECELVAVEDVAGDEPHAHGERLCAALEEAVAQLPICW